MVSMNYSGISLFSPRFGFAGTETAGLRTDDAATLGSCAVCSGSESSGSKSEAGGADRADLLRCENATLRARLAALGDPYR